MKDTLMEIKNNLQGNNSRVNKAEDQIKYWECREVAKMKRQRNMAQMKEQTKTPGKELNKMDISNLADVEFKHWL